MNLEIASKLRSLLAAAESIIAEELAKATPPAVDTDSMPIQGAPLPYGKHGFTDADEDGFARFKALDEWLAKVPKHLRGKFPTRFCTAELWELGVFPSAIAREKCYQNLIMRMTSPIATPLFFNWDAWTFSVTHRDVPADRDWNIGPLQAGKTYDLRRADLLVGQAWSENWKPGGEARLLEALKAKLARELESESSRKS